MYGAAGARDESLSTLTEGLSAWRLITLPSFLARLSMSTPLVFGTPFLPRSLRYSLHQVQNSHRVNRPALLSLQGLPDVSSPIDHNRFPLSPSRPYSLVNSKSCPYHQDPYVANVTEHGLLVSALWRDALGAAIQPLQRRSASAAPLDVPTVQTWCCVTSSPHPTPLSSQVCKT